MARKPKAKPEPIDLNKAQTPPDIRKMAGEPGPPKSFDYNWLETIGRLAMLGMINDQIAEFYNVSDTTMDNWIKSIPELRQVLIENRELADARVAASLFRRAVGLSTLRRWTKKARMGVSAASRLSTCPAM